MNKQELADRLIAKVDHAIDWMESACKLAANAGIDDPPAIILATLILRAEACGVEYESIVKAISHWRAARRCGEFKQPKRELDGNGDTR